MTLSDRALDFYRRSLAKSEDHPPLEVPNMGGKTVLVLYRSTKPHMIDASTDTWMFLALDQAEYGISGRILDMIMLMDGITKSELVTHPKWIYLFPNLKEGYAILEAA